MNRRPQGPTSGYTLLELMVVLAILATLTAIGLPMLRRPLNKSHLQGGAQQLSKTLADLRLVAMQEGRAHLFRYQVGASGYQSCPAELMLADPSQLDSESEATTLDTTSSTASGVDTASDGFGYEGDDQLTAQPDTVEMESLPDGVRFFDAVLDTVESRLDEQAVEDRQLVEVPVLDAGLEEDGGVDSANWSTPVLFYPDGRATSVKLTLISDEGYEVDVHVRGLTGAVRSGPIRRTAGAAAEGAVIDDGVTEDAAAEGAVWEEDIPEQPIP